MRYADELIAAQAKPVAVQKAAKDAVAVYGYHSPEFVIYQQDVVPGLRMVTRRGASAGRASIRAAVTAACGLRYPASKSN